MALLQTETPIRCRRCSTNDAVLKIRIDHVCRWVCQKGPSSPAGHVLSFPDHLCSDCYCRFIATKTVKRLEVLNRDTRGAAQLHRPRGGSASAWRASNSKTFLVGLSFGPSSASLVAVCEQIIAGQVARGRDAAFTLHVVHVDTDLDGGDGDGNGNGSENENENENGNGASDEQLRVTQLLDRWRRRFPRFTFERVPLADVLALEAIDWSLLSVPAENSDPSSAATATATATTPSSHPSPAGRLRAMLARLPSASSRQDVLDMLVRRLLIARAAAASHRALLLGCSTTALAERTLAETAKGRGFSLPWQIHDGPPAEAVPGGPPPEHDASTLLLLYYPLRELFRKELVTYAGLAQPALSDLIYPPLSSAVDPGQRTSAAVVSHKHLSIEEVMARYFADVEGNYPSVVANVVKTATKLERRGDVSEDEDTWTRAAELEGQGTAPEDNTERQRRRRADQSCGTCGMPLDDLGNERWKGEIGELGSIDSSDGQRPPGGAPRLCYGCERSIKG